LFTFGHEISLLFGEEKEITLLFMFGHEILLLFGEEKEITPFFVLQNFIYSDRQLKQKLK
jgi:hypothetical protein